MRLIGGSGVLAVYVSVLHPIGLLDESPTVLGLRTFALTSPEDFDVVVPVRSLLMRVEGLLESAAAADPTEGIVVTIPMTVNTVTWAAISPPRGGWNPLPGADWNLLDRVARAGIDEVARAIPDGTGEQIVHRVRTEIWGFPHRQPRLRAAGLLSLLWHSDSSPRVRRSPSTSRARGLA